MWHILYKCCSETPATRMGQISFRVDDELEELIEKEQEKQPYDVPKSEIIRTALRKHLQGNATAAKAMTAD